MAQPVVQIGVMFKCFILITTEPLLAALTWSHIHTHVHMYTRLHTRDRENVHSCMDTYITRPTTL